MEVVLDTDGLSAAAGDDAAMAGCLVRASRILLPTVTVGEYRFGLLRSRRRSELEQWLAEFISRVEVAPVSLSTAEHYAVIRVELKESGRPIPDNDIWIAATARQYGAAVLSRDRHFDFVPGLRRVSW